VKIDPEMVSQLEAITSLSRAECTGLLEAAQGKLDKAIEIHFGSANTDSNNHNQKKNSTNSKLTPPASTNGNSSKTANKRPIANAARNDDFDDESSSSNSAAATANGCGDDYVRAPIPKKSDKLLDYDPYVSSEPKSKRLKSVFDGYDHYNDLTEPGAASSSNSSKMKSLAAMYRPPIEILFKGSFEASKIQGTKSNKWILLNVQNQSDFACQCLNRDVWRDDTVKEIVKGNFIFVQVFADSADGKKLANYYRINSYPFVAILDPRTGENVKQFNAAKLDQLAFCEKTTQFLCEHGDGPSQDHNDDNDEIEVKQETKKVEVVEIDDSSSSSAESLVAKPAAKEKASDVIKKALLEKSNTSEEEEEEVNWKKKPVTKKKTIDDDDDDDEDEHNSSYSKTNGNDSNSRKYDVKDCLIRVMCPNGERIDFETNGEAPFKDLTDELRKRGYKKSSYELIERLMPVFSSASTTSASSDQPSSSYGISSELSNLAITTSSNHSRNLFNLDDPRTSFKKLNLFPRVFLLLQEI